jgi:hypothetical protein
MFFWISDPVFYFTGNKEEIMMTKSIRGLVLLLAVCVVPFSAVAGDFDGSKPLLCAVVDVVECKPGGECQRTTAEAVKLPHFLVINFAEGVITATPESTSARTTKIERTEYVDGKMIIQGAEDGREGIRDGLGWTLAIAEDTGLFVLTASGDGVGFVVFGACTPR